MTILEPKAPIGVTPPLILVMNPQARAPKVSAPRSRPPQALVAVLCLSSVVAACAGRSPATSGGDAAKGTSTAAGGATGTGGASAGSGGSTGAGGGAGGGAAGGMNGGVGGTAGHATDGGVDRGAMGGMMRTPVTAATGTTLVKVDTNLHHQHFEGWGTSLCWWANHVGGWAEAKRNALVDNMVDATNGLGYNVFRYNIGGGDDPTHTHMGQFKNIPGFEPTSGTWDWTADANQRAILQRIVTSGTGVVLEAFSNSPPYWMTNSGCASGATSGANNNLRDDSYNAFADYLTEVVKHFRDSFGITFRTLEALNEPNATWWVANGGQEGCRFAAANQQTIVKAVSASLAAKGLTGTTVSASDENSIDDGYNIMHGYDATSLAGMSQMNTHTYSGTRRTDLRALATADGKRLWASESGPLNQTLADDTAAAVFMAGRIITDLRDLQAEAWVDWQVGDPSANWASYTLNDAQQSFGFLRRFYMHAGFSRYIRPGATFVDVNNANMVAAVSPDGSRLAIVVLNSSTTASAGFTFDLTALATVGTAAEVHRVSRTENLVALTALPIQSYSFVATVAPASITTFVVPMP